MDGTREGSNTTTGILLGTPHYMSPEQIQNSYEVDKRSDIYSLGATLYETISGRKPFSGDISSILQTKILYMPPPLSSVASVSPALNAVVMRCLDLDRNNRFPNATSLQQALYETPEFAENPRLYMDIGAREPSPEGAPADGVRTTEAPSTSTSGPEATLRLSATLVVAKEEASLAAGRNPLPFAAIPPGGALRLTSSAAEAVPPPRIRERPRLPSEKPLRAELIDYLGQAGLRAIASERGLIHLERRPESRLPDVELAAMLLDEGDDVEAPQVTLDTLSFQRRASSLYELSGTPERPIHVIAVFRGNPGAGIYRQWHDLLQTRHVRVLPLSPNELRAHVQCGSAARHVLSLLQRPASNTFQLEGPVEREVDFFGSSGLLGELVARLAGGGQSFGVFGLKKWGTTSFLRRLRMELKDHVTAWVDVTGLLNVSAAEVMSTLYEDFSRELRRKAPGAPASSLSPHERHDGRAAAEALRRLLWAYHEAHAGGGPIFFLDGVDELTRGRSCAIDDLQVLCRSLYSFMSLEPRAILVFAGAEDDIVSRQTIGTGEMRFENPFWARVDRYCAPLFDENELGEFFRAAGALAGLQFKREALEEAYRITGGHKYLCRLLGSELHRRQAGAAASRSIDLKDVQECTMPLIAECSDYFSRLLLDAPPWTGELLSQLSKGPVSERDLLSLNHGNRSMHRLRALRFSVMHGLARKEPGGSYRLAIGLMGEWLQWSSPSAFREQGLADGVRGESTAARAFKEAEAHRSKHEAETRIENGPTTEERIELRRMIVDRFQPSELELLADNLGVELMAVTSPQRPLPNQALDLVRWASQHGQFGRLRQLVQHHRYGGPD
ncbi:uncharacterized protein SOCE26_051550 [Sorangium cellulosum]|uniref:Protein kinase domain-containing protein n=1 Tax=Sorangium cellulosum TaxID=56 RepID=A0A2L0EWM7_SORCE|nr:uncharacterized protein SOCE26_051550 [Sorangium cellulosum]